MDLRQLTYFVAVVEEGTLTAAARRLHMTQPPLSLAISRLEKDLGVQLLERHARGVTPTRAGLHLVSVARRLLMDTDRLRKSLTAMGAGLSGELRIGAEPIGLWNLLGERVTVFTATYPDVSISLVDRPPGDLMELIRDGEVDVAVVPSLEPTHLATELGDQLHALVTGQVHLRIVAPRAWTELAPGPVHLEELLDRPWILPSRIPGLRILPEAVDEVFTRAGRRPGRIIEVSTPHTGLPLVAAGLGLSVVTEGVAEHLPGMRSLELEGGFPGLALMTLWRRGVSPTPPMENFLAMLAEGTTGHSPDEPA